MKTRTSLAAALKQKRPFASVQHEAYLSILRTASELSHSAEQRLREFSITPPQYNVLRILRGAGPEGLCRNEIRDRMINAMPDMSRLLERMEKAGWIVRQRGNEDRRQVSTSITPAGTALAVSLDEPLFELHRRQFQGIPEPEIRRLLTLLDEVRAAAE